MVDAVPLQSDFGRYIINDGAKTRRRDRREDKRRLACEEAVTKSRLSYHMVKFENSIKVIFQSVPVSPEPEIIVKFCMSNLIITFLQNFFSRNRKKKLKKHDFFFQLYLSFYKEKRAIFCQIIKESKSTKKFTNFFDYIFNNFSFFVKKCRNRRKIHDFFTKNS